MFDVVILKNSKERERERKSVRKKKKKTKIGVSARLKENRPRNKIFRYCEKEWQREDYSFFYDWINT